jgi:hypothetical protein
MASIMGGNYPGGGITLGPAITFGYIAARHMAGADRVVGPDERVELDPPVQADDADLRAAARDRRMAPADRTGYPRAAAAG